MAEITLTGVTKRFDNDVVAVDAVDLDIADGEFVVLVGPSGCGKSTLLRMVAGLEEPDAGSVFIGGRDVTRLQPKDRDIAMVFQSYALYSHKTVHGNIAYPLKLAGLSRAEIEAKVQATAARLHLDELLDRRPGQLSGGQRQRVAMARALVRQPKAFLMDEPLSNLDAKLRVEMRAEIARLQRSTGVTTIYVTHDQVEAMTMGDRAAVLDRGRLQQVGTPQELYDEPASVFVATFIGSPAMNLFPATTLADGNVDIGGPVLHVGARLTQSQDVGPDVVVGLRPEAFTDAALDTGDPGDRVVEVEVDLVEARGAELVVHTLLPGPDDRDPAQRTRLVARLPPKSRVRPGDVIKLAVDTDQIHLFDPDTGAAGRGNR
ncbi:MAG: ABC transporter ATP-binding protein [Acidimicrobiales bacterium]